jgi:hypothetical protein
VASGATARALGAKTPPAVGAGARDSDRGGRSSSGPARGRIASESAFAGMVLPMNHRALSLPVGAPSANVRQYRDGALHRSAEIAGAGILYPPVRTRRNRLMFAVETGVEATVIDECARTEETQPERGGLTARALSPREEVIRAPVSGTIEAVVADDRMIVRVVVDPLYDVSPAYDQVEGLKAVFLRDDDVT